MNEPRLFLNVQSSVTGRRWIGPDAGVERAAQQIEQITTLPGIIARLLAERGVEANEADSYLSPKLRDLMPDPSALADMDAAADRLANAVRRNQRIAIFGDYDVDGGASVARAGPRQSHSPIATAASGNSAASTAARIACAVAVSFPFGASTPCGNRRP